ANRQAMRDQQAQDQRVQDAAREDAQNSNLVQNTQNKKSSSAVGSGGTTVFSTALTGDEGGSGDEDSLKRLIRRGV
ncbi:MAG: hypothetical protein ACRC6A_05640, partial [Fusobacteriaceae bacterium]